MKKFAFVLLLSAVCLLIVSSVFSQNGEPALIGEVTSKTPVTEIVWDASGSLITGISRDVYGQNRVTGGTADSFSIEDKGYITTTVSGSGVMAGLLADRQTVDVYTEPMDPDKAPLSIEPGFTVLSVDVSDDGSLVLADSADEIRTVVCSTADGKVVYDLSGFETAAPVYDSVLSADSSRVVWHSRGTFAVQEVKSGAFGETISLWDFASSYALSPDNKTLAVGIINDDYENGAVIFFDPQTGAEKGRALLGKNAPYELVYSAAGSALLAADADTVYWIDPKNFTLLGRQTVTAGADDTRISQAAPSPDGKSAAVHLSDGSLYLVTR